VPHPPRSGKKFFLTAIDINSPANCDGIPVLLVDSGCQLSNPAVFFYFDFLRMSLGGNNEAKEN